MILFARLASVISIALFGSVALGGASAGAAGLAAGEYHTVSLDANAFFESSDFTQVYIIVNDTTATANPKVGASTTTHTGQLSIQIFGYTVSGDGCFDLAPSAFTASSDLQTASVHATLTEATGNCGGPPSSLPLPLTVDVTWTGIGPVGTSRGSSRFDCGGYTLESQGTSSRIDDVSATAVLTPLFTDAFTGTQGGVRTNDARDQAQGVLPDACPPGAPTRGAGFTPQVAGNYHFTSLQAGASFTSDSGDQVNIFMFEGTQDSNPKNGPATSNHDITLNVRIGGFFGIGGCFRLAPADFTTNGVQTAVLHVTITDATPVCPEAPDVTLPLPQTFDVTWSGTGPVATLRGRGQTDCLEVESLTVTDPATVTASVTPLLTGTFTDNQTSLLSTDQRIHVQGVNEQPC
jgi:hypothetical protein